MTLRMLDEGKLDNKFRDPEAKAFIRDHLNTELVRLLTLPRM